MQRSSKRGRLARAVAETLDGRHLLASVSAVSPYNGQQTVDVASNISVTFGSAMIASTLTNANVTLRGSDGVLVPSALSYNATTRVLTLDPTPNLVSSSGYYTVRVAGGSSGVKGTDGSTLNGGDLASYFTAGAPNLTTQTVLSGFNRPTNVEFADNGRVYVAEQAGVIKVFDGLTDTTPTIAADLRTNVHNYWDRGLLGMALHPDFTKGSPYIYVLYTCDADVGGTAPKWGTVGGAADGGGADASANGANVSCRLSRFAVDASGVMTGQEQVLINDWADMFPSHSIGDLKFGPDGYLYASGGDGASFNQVDYGQIGSVKLNDPANEGGALRSQDILSDNDPTALDGSIIRIDPDTGAAAPGNPFGSSADANKRRIIANGLRNPFRITFKPGTHELYIADTGWNTWEEINKIDDVMSAAKAQNFGWPAYEGPNAQSGYKAANLPLLQPLYNNPNLVTSPWFAYQHTQQIVGGSEPTGGSTPTGLAFYTGSNYPAAFKNAFFFCDYARQRVYVMYAGPDGQINQASRQIVASGGNVELTVGPSGDIFAVDLNAGTVTRLVATGYQRPPVADFTADKTSGPLPLTVNFDARASGDPDGGSLYYAWDLDGDGDYDDSIAAAPNWTYTKGGTVTVGLKVTDTAGLSATKSLVITPANSAPVPTITLPATTLRYTVGDTLTFAGGATDAEDGTLAASKLTWSLSIVHANDIDPGNTHEHLVTSYVGVRSGSFVAPDHEAPSWLVLRLTATDSGGLSATTSLRVDPRTVTLAFTTTPAGLKISVNGTEYAGPFSTTVNAGSANSLAVATSQTLVGTSYAFANWSQGGAAAQTLKAPAADATYTAVFTTAAPPTGIPVVPTNLAATVLTGPQVRLTWTDASASETAFVIQRRYAGWTWGDLATAAANATAFIDTTAIGNVQYEYRVAARNASGTSAWGNAVAVDTSKVGDAAPAAPSALAATAVSATRVDLAWQDNSTNETGFRVERRVAGGTFALLASVGANAKVYSDTTTVAGIAYEYRVIATGASQNSAASNVAAVATPGGSGTIPAAPSSFTAVKQTGTSVKATWKDNSTNETGFRIERRYRDWVWETLATVGSNVLTYTDATAYSGAAYEYRVIALGSAGNSGPSSGTIVDLS